MSTSARLKVSKPNVVSQTIDDEAVVVNLKTGSYYSLRGTGTEIWNLVEAGTSKQAVLNEMQTRYSPGLLSISQEVDALLETLEVEGLITIDLTLFDEAEVQPGPSKPRDEFTRPLYEKYEDMQDLILLDPVHEVEESEGWPTRPGANNEAKAAGQ